MSKATINRGGRGMATRAKAQMQELADTTPDLNELRENFLWCVQRRDSTTYRRSRINFNTRYCIWPNQFTDGRKWKSSNGAPPFPWEGASDARVPLTDLYINQDVAQLMVVWQKMKTICVGTETSDAAFANRLTAVLRWMKYTQMKEAWSEMTLAANYMLEGGTAVVQVAWEKRKQNGYETVTLQDLQTFAQQAQAHAQQSGNADGLEELMELPAVVMDPSREDNAVELAKLRWPDVQTSVLRRAVVDLRTTGTARIVRPYVKMNRPVLAALRPNEELFIPPEATDLQTARNLWRRELVTETTLMDRVQAMEYDPAWVNEMIATQRGKVTTDFDGNMFHRVQRVNSTGVLNTEKLFEVIHAFERRHDANGVPGIYQTVFSAHMTQKGQVGYHGLLDYDHGEYPFVLFQREVRGRLTDDPRGYGEIANTWQNQIKNEWDSRMDLASLAVLPPSHYPPGEPPDRWGPGVQIPTNRPEDYGFMEVPHSGTQVSEEVEHTVRVFADEYFGRSADPTKAPLMGAVKQHFIDGWLIHNREVDMQILQLMQQYMPDEFYYRIVGDNKGRSIKATRDEIQGQFDISLGFSAENLDTELVQKKIELMQEAVQMDTTGRVDRDEVLSVLFDLVDPSLGERLLKPGQEGSQSEIDDEQGVFSKIWSGQQVDIKPGQAYGLRLNWLKSMLPANKSAQQRYQQDPQFKQNLDRRVQQLQFQEEQRENAITGKFLGTKLSAQQQAAGPSAPQMGGGPAPQGAPQLGQ